MAGREHPVSGRVVERVADSSDSDPLELPPLFERVEPDALEAFVRGTADGVVEFQYAGHAVTVDCRGEVEVEELIAGDSSSEGAVNSD